MWDAANKAKRRSGADADGAGQFKNFDQLYNDRLKDDPNIDPSQRAGLEDLPHPGLCKIL